jgi:hypothetical protein
LAAILGLTVPSIDLGEYAWIMPLAFGVMGIGIATAGVIYLAAIPSARKQWIAVTPNGWVQYLGRWNTTFAVEFGALSELSLRLPVGISSYTGLQLVVKPQHAGSRPEHREWPIHPKFERQAELIQALVEAYTRYTANITPTA